MAISHVRLAAAGALPLLLCGCRITDNVAWGPGADGAAHEAAAEAGRADARYGDYDPQNPPQVLALASDISLADPTMFRWQDTYWVLSTGPGISVYSSKDLKAFQAEKQVFDPNPAWIASKLPKVGDLWSPSVLAWNGTIHLYYAASTYGSKQACIGHATTTSMGQPFNDKGPLICSNVGTDDAFTAIDPAVILDAQGDPWLSFGSWVGGVKLIRLDREGNANNSELYTIADRPEGGGIQAASLYRWREYYYLFASFGPMSSHILRVGRATQLNGPFFDRDGKAMLEGGGTLVLQSDSRYTGPGSNMVFDDLAQRLNVYHAYDGSGAVVLRIAQLAFDDDGWPISGGP